MSVPSNGDVVLVTEGSSPPAGAVLFVNSVGSWSASLWRYGQVWVSVPLVAIEPATLEVARPFILEQGKIAADSTSELHAEVGRLHRRCLAKSRAHGAISVLAVGALTDLRDELVGLRATVCETAEARELGERWENAGNLLEPLTDDERERLFAWVRSRARALPGPWKSAAATIGAEVGLRDSGPIVGLGLLKGSLELFEAAMEPSPPCA